MILNIYNENKPLLIAINNYNTIQNNLEFNLFIKSEFVSILKQNSNVKHQGLGFVPGEGVQSNNIGIVT
jgi:hypothetical protein